MAQIPESTLAWLYSRLHEYHDPQRTYSDAVRTLSAHPSLSPKTEVYTYENGAVALLLTLSGTLPVVFRGNTYHFPTKLWVPHSYPHECPMVYVVAGKDMVIRPGQHVGVDGKVYHPYLRDWSRMWDRASIAEFLEFLQQVFAREPPVISRTQQPQYREPPRDVAQGPPNLPPKPGSGRNVPIETPGDMNRPPPLPPKPGEEYAEPARDVSRDGPPLPPLPHELAQNSAKASSSDRTADPPNGYRQPPRTPSGSLSALSPGQQNGSSGGRPSPLPTGQPQSYQHRANYERSPVSPISPVHGYSELPEARYSRPPALPHAPHQVQHNQQFPQNAQQRSYQSQIQQRQSQPFQPGQHAQQVHPQMPKQRQQPAPDLLSDPFDVALPGSSGSSVPAPPIPPNPEKEHLLQAISGTLVQQAQQKVNQNLSAIAPLQAQQNSLRVAYDRLDGEIRQLEQLDQMLSSNEAILHRSIQECDRTIATAKSKKQPPIDEVLIAPTMVANQLWTLCAEEAACREAMYVLQKAVDRGRVGGNDFVRQIRGLGRECFLKMALSRKCARGMGLELRR